MSIMSCLFGFPYLIKPYLHRMRTHFVLIKKTHFTAVSIWAFLVSGKHLIINIICQFIPGSCMY